MEVPTTLEKFLKRIPLQMLDASCNTSGTGADVCELRLR
jgi:hypothetical protein